MVLLLAASAFAGQFTTFDGESYTYDCPGEYSLSELTQGQYRYSASILVDAALSSTGITVPNISITSLALSSSRSLPLQVEVNSGSALRILLSGTDLSSVVQNLLTDEGSFVPLSCLLSGSGCSRIVNGVTVTSPPAYGVYSGRGFSAIITNRTSCRLVLDSGISVQVDLVLSVGSLSVSIALPLTFRADRSSAIVAGLLGNFNGNTSDEFYFRGNASSPARYLSVPLSLYDAFFYFCKQCKCRGLSMFVYVRGGDGCLGEGVDADMNLHVVV